MVKKKYFSGEGDEGLTGLLGSGRHAKSDLRFETLGSIEELSSILGIAKSSVSEIDINADITEIQRCLYRIMADISFLDPADKKKDYIEGNHIDWLEDRITTIGDGITMPGGFIIPGDTQVSALIDYARTSTRRVERRLVELDREVTLHNAAILPFINRLSSYLYVLELHSIQSDHNQKPTMAKK